MAMLNNQRATYVVSVFCLYSFHIVHTTPTSVTHGGSLLPKHLPTAQGILGACHVPNGFALLEVTAQQEARPPEP